MTHPSEPLSALLDGELTEPDRTRVVDHLSTCHACRDELNELHSARASVRSLPLLDLPSGLSPVEKGVAEVLSLRRRPPAWVAAAAAAILALFIGVATILAPPTSLEVRLDQLSDQYGARTSLEPAITPRTPLQVIDRVAGPIE
ncbi:MAG: zf-HC2 domain-containing protein [Acidimicrobiia bacterium]|nr:zf-HC2 domain-containing protein [Acidimicrobiia bacterium]